METVTIPEFMRPFECTINNVHYGPYAPGATVEVPAEVAALIKNNAALEPRENPPETIEEEIARIAGQIAEAKVAAALEDYPVFIDLSSKTFEAGTPLNVTDKLSRLEFVELYSYDLKRPASVEVTYDSKHYYLPETAVVGSKIYFSTPDIDSSGYVIGFLTVQFYLDVDKIWALLQYTEIPESEE